MLTPLTTVLFYRDTSACRVWRARSGEQRHACSEGEGWPRGDTYLPRAGVNETEKVLVERREDGAE